jgi:hypothetical protein
MNTLPPIDLAPLLEKADAEIWLDAIKLWHREERRRVKALTSIMLGAMGIFVVATLISSAKTAGSGLAEVLEAAVKPVDPP